MSGESEFPPNGHARFAPESGHVRCITPCRLWANSGHLPLGIPLAVLPARPVINICAITLGGLIYQFGEAATKLSIKNVFDAFYAFILR